MRTARSSGNASSSSARPLASACRFAPAFCDDDDDDDGDDDDDNDDDDEDDDVDDDDADADDEK